MVKDNRIVFSELTLRSHMNMGVHVSSKNDDTHLDI